MNELSIRKPAEFSAPVLYILYNDFFLPLFTNGTKRSIMIG